MGGVEEGGQNTWLRSFCPGRLGVRGHFHSLALDRLLQRPCTASPPPHQEEGL